MSNIIQIEESWKEILHNEFEQAYFLALKNFLISEKQQGKIIYPKGNDIFNAFALTPFNNVKVVILGQDPYHGKNQAHGLCFSVQHGIKPPPSLVNIYKELQQDLHCTIPNHGNLTEWAEQGVFLLNTILTVEASKPASHQKKGWENFIDAVIQAISTHNSGIVFLLWGKHAQNKASLIDANKHHILQAAHPSPFSAHNGFFGCKHFSTTNKLLKQQNKNIINWQITNTSPTLF
ncbi:MAG: uracil-DNA glycosylase [Chitinophagales bacterium]|nr:uracil-DNA glycosylase [Chitinophagales bacterium]